MQHANYEYFEMTPANPASQQSGYELEKSKAFTMACTTGSNVWLCDLENYLEKIPKKEKEKLFKNIKRRIWPKAKRNLLLCPAELPSNLRHAQSMLKIFSTLLSTLSQYGHSDLCHAFLGLLRGLVFGFDVPVHVDHF